MKPHMFSFGKYIYTAILHCAFPGGRGDITVEVLILNVIFGH